MRHAQTDGDRLLCNPDAVKNVLAMNAGFKQQRIFFQGTGLQSTDRLVASLKS
ncbi:hypothetical protein [Owenweeksia hongkongensis]|uniref:hypothetical protein n=1 Tax=Owenweeksia hongkongensis TaxID=253245 RepID=UPI003A8F8DCE